MRDLLFPALLLSLFLGSCSNEAPNSPPVKSKAPVVKTPTVEKAPGAHKGKVHVVEGFGKIEVVFDTHNEGKEVRLFLSDAKGAPLLIGHPPRIEVPTKAGPRVITTEPGELTEGLASEFTASDPSLKGSDIRSTLKLQTESGQLHLKIHLFQDHSTHKH